MHSRAMHEVLAGFGQARLSRIIILGMTFYPRRTDETMAAYYY